MHMAPATRPPTKDPWEDPSLRMERESHATHRRRKAQEAQAHDEARGRGDDKA